jgi:hypothetical protein
MSRNQRILGDLNALGKTVPDAASTRRAVDRTHFALEELFSAHAAVSDRNATRMLVHTFGAIAAAAIFIVYVAQWLPPGSNGNIAFAQVQADVAKTKSVQYVRRMTYPGQKDGFNGIERVTILGSDLIRTEITWNPPVLSPFPNAKQVSRVIDIHNERSHMTITLYPEIKEYFVAVGTQFALDSSAVVKTHVGDVEGARVNGRQEWHGFYESFRAVPSELAKPLPERVVDGKRAVGFVIENKTQRADGAVTDRTTYWVDTTTKLPIRIERCHRSTLPPGGGGTYDEDSVISDIVFDAPLEAAIFSIDPPEGWTDLAAQKPTADGNLKSK